MEKTAGRRVPWSTWPDRREALLPILEDRAPFDKRSGLVREDRLWKERLVRSIGSGSLSCTVPESSSVVTRRAAIDTVTYRLYHVARTLQTHFKNPAFGNFRNPFLESLLILLSWRSRIDTAHKILSQIINEIESPRELLAERTAQKHLEQIASRAGFTGKRPAMILQLTSAFITRFPDEDLSELCSWSDADLVDFLTSIPGIGYKSALCVLMYSLGRDRLPIDAHIRRVLRRAQFLRELYFENGNKNHKIYQDEAEVFTPPGARRVLHTGLLALGREYCKPIKPSCATCPVRKVCAYDRHDKIKLAQIHTLTHVELFSGVGGFGLGLSEAGFRTVLAVDQDEHATLSYVLNHTAVPSGNVFARSLQEEDVPYFRKRVERWKEELQPHCIDVITAGIPCQGFSKAGFRTRPGLKYDILADPRNHLYKVIVAWTAELVPKYVVVENVPGILSAGNGERHILSSVISAFHAIGYSCEYTVINAASFGVAQTRHRMILVASHPDVQPLDLTSLEKYYKPPKDLISAIGDLPPISADSGSWYTLIKNNVVTSHRARYNNSDDLQIFEAIRPGERYKDFIRRRHDLIEERAKSTRAVYKTSSFPDKYRKLLPNEPSRTIVSHLQKDGNGYIHPEQARSLTPREAARLQGFPDSFVFTGIKGIQFTHIGNAMPPPVAKALGKMIAKKLRGQR